MPQLDKVTLALHYFWFGIYFIGLFSFMSWEVLPRLYTLFFIRKYIQQGVRKKLNYLIGPGYREFDLEFTIPDEIFGVLSKDCLLSDYFMHLPVVATDIKGPTVLAIDFVPILNEANCVDL